MVNNNVESRSLVSMFDWFASRQYFSSISWKRQEPEITDGWLNKCNTCRVVVYNKVLRANQIACLKCGHPASVNSAEYIYQLIVNVRDLLETNLSIEKGDIKN